MKRTWRQQNAVSFVVGFVFAIGLSVARMTQPEKILHFLNPWDWDPTLLFVMIGAVLAHALTYPWIRRRKSPLLSLQWHVPNRQDVTSRLVIGSAIFGVGWGLGGYCPGPGLTALSAGHFHSFVFVTTMALGMILFKKTGNALHLKE